MNARGNRTKTAGAKNTRLIGWLPILLTQAALIASVGALLSLAYLMFIIMAGGLAAPVVAGTALDQLRRNVELARDVFLWCLWILILVSMVRHYKTESLGFLFMLVGAGLWFLLPFIIRTRIEATTVRALLELGQSLITSFQTSGGLIITVGFLRVVLGKIFGLASPTKAAARLKLSGSGAVTFDLERRLERPSLMRRCWELQFCRSNLRSNCPRFLDAISCWKRKSGCYCDQGLATRLLTGVGPESRMKVAEEFDSAHRRALSQRTKRKNRKALCGECPIYLEHQKYKYRVVSWLTYPVAAAIIGTGVGTIQSAYRWVEVEMGAFLARFQLLPRELTDTVFEPAAWFSAQNVAIILIGVLLVGVLLQLTEVAIFRLKL